MLDKYRITQSRSENSRLENLYKCPKCNGTEAKLGDGKPPHSASLRCANCNRWIKWIGKAELKARLAQIESFTRLMEVQSER